MATKEVVDKLNQQQKSGEFHLYTWGNCRDKLGIYYARNKVTGEERHIGLLGKPVGDEEVVIHDRELVATEDGWICPTCITNKIGVSHRLDDIHWHVRTK